MCAGWCSSAQRTCALGARARAFSLISFPQIRQVCGVCWSVHRSAHVPHRSDARPNRSRHASGRIRPCVHSLAGVCCASGDLASLGRSAHRRKMMSRKSRSEWYAIAHRVKLVGERSLRAGQSTSIGRAGPAADILREPQHAVHINIDVRDPVARPYVVSAARVECSGTRHSLFCRRCST